jgi:hypothetical protein
MTDEFEQAAIAYYRQQRASRDALHDALIVAEGQRDQAKMRAEAAESELRAFLAQRSQVISVGAILAEVDALRAERDALRNEWSGLLIEQARLMALRDEAIAERDKLAARIEALPRIYAALEVQP